MLNMMKADMYRIVRGKAIYIITLIIIALEIVNIISMSAGAISMGINPNLVTGDEYDYEYLEKLEKANSISEYRKIIKDNGGFELDTDIMAENGNFYYIIIVLVIIVVTCDFSNKSVKNTLSSAISRKKYYISKMLLLYLITTIVLVFNTYFSYFLNLLVNGSSFVSSIGNVTKILLLQLPLIYGIITLLGSIAFITRKTSIFNAISIPLIAVVELIAMGICTLFRLDAVKIFEYDFTFMLRNIANNQTDTLIMKSLVLAIVYIVLFNIVGYFVFKKSEVK